MIVYQMFRLDLAFLSTIKSYPKTWDRQMLFNNSKGITAGCKLFQLSITNQQQSAINILMLFNHIFREAWWLKVKTLTSP